MLSEPVLLGAALARRAPDLVKIVERMHAVPLTDDERERVRRAIVDELRELPEGSSVRRALQLEELPIHLCRA